MMLENYLIPAIEKAYNESCAGDCEGCENSKYCTGSCDDCLEQVHWYPKYGGRPDYTCQNLLYKYVLQFNERYKEQILSIDECIDLSRFSHYDIFSIGCGATPDLMAFEEMAGAFGNGIYYKGYDRNPLWTPIHNFIQEYADKTGSFEAKLRQKDIFDVFSEEKPRNHHYNIVIVQYLISHLFNIGQEDQIDALYDGIIHNVLKNRASDSPFLIAIFDVDSVNKGRNQWYRLLDKLEQCGYYGNAYAKSSYRTGDLGEERWSSYKKSDRFGNIIYHYSPNNSEHDPAQLIIELE